MASGAIGFTLPDSLEIAGTPTLQETLIVPLAQRLPLPHPTQIIAGIDGLRISRSSCRCDQLLTKLRSILSLLTGNFVEVTQRRNIRFQKIIDGQWNTQGLTQLPQIVAAHRPVTDQHRFP